MGLPAGYSSRWIREALQRNSTLSRLALQRVETSCRQGLRTDMSLGPSFKAPWSPRTFGSSSSPPRRQVRVLFGRLHLVSLGEKEQTGLA